MQHRDRVLTALDHETPDRCPMQISFTPEFAARLRQELQIPAGAEHNPHGGGNTYVLERRLDETAEPLVDPLWFASYDFDYEAKLADAIRAGRESV